MYYRRGGPAETAAPILGLTPNELMCTMLDVAYAAPKDLRRREERVKHVAAVLLRGEFRNLDFPEEWDDDSDDGDDDCYE